MQLHITNTVLCSFLGGEGGATRGQLSIIWPYGIHAKILSQSSGSVSHTCIYNITDLSIRYCTLHVVHITDEHSTCPRPLLTESLCGSTHLSDMCMSLHLGDKFVRSVEHTTNITSNLSSMWSSPSNPKYIYIYIYTLSALPQPGLYGAEDLQFDWDVFTTYTLHKNSKYRDALIYYNQGATNNAVSQPQELRTTDYARTHTHMSSRHDVACITATKSHSA